ncbi:MAG: SRPBCC domain-containing protein [SAR202 cluster bacterium]|nr:SRPBCC domain-containing protein [SAR202 cluster bacterium]
MGITIGQLAVRRSILLDASPERIWQEFTTLERLRRWFGTGHTLLRYEPRVGGQVELQVDINGAMMHFGGRVVVFEPSRELTFEDDWIPNQGWAAPTYLTLRLTPRPGGTLLELFHHGFERVGPHAASEHRGYEAGWGMRQLEALRQVVEG